MTDWTPLLAILDVIWRWVVPSNVSYLFVDVEASLFIPILAYGWVRGWWTRLRGRMDAFLGLERHCPSCGADIS